MAEYGVKRIKGILSDIQPHFQKADLDTQNLLALLQSDSYESSTIKPDLENLRHRVALIAQLLGRAVQDLNAQDSITDAIADDINKLKSLDGD